MTSRYKVINIRSLLDKKSAESISYLLSAFSCPHNQDVETFLKDRSISFALQGIAQTHLVLMKEARNFELLGFFTLALKILDIPFLTGFYASNGFRRISPDTLDKGELVQMIRYQ
jgi:hypothetical protein